MMEWEGRGGEGRGGEGREEEGSEGGKGEVIQPPLHT